MTLDPTAFDALYAAQADRLYRSALGIVRDPDAAADVVQEAFVRAYTADDEITSPSAWLATVTRHLALNELRRRSRLTGIAEDATDDEEPSGTTLVESAVWTDPAKSAASADSVAGVAACLAEQRPDDRTILTFRYGEGLEIGAIAELLGRTVNATTVALHRARARFDATYADRLFARASLPEPCRGWRTDAVAHADGKPAAPAYLVHLATCGSCRETDADLRSRSKAFALAPLFGLPVAVPATLKVAVMAGLAGHGIAVGAAGSAGTTLVGAAGGTAATSGGSGASLAGLGVGAKVLLLGTLAATIVGGAVLLRPGGSTPRSYAGQFVPAGSLETPHSTHAAVL
ncbi:MAG: sigma-70 family RNA polymerase sigma factor, partial [Isosphaeraceae bacterium]|nr:sigma-70 family RNA polymerase sigma factor [Isosphaeraceae bacterium]